MDSLEWAVLAESFSKNAKKINYETNKHLFTKVAFDVFQLNVSPQESLWVLENDENGQPYLVAMYDNQPTIEASATNWSALPDKEAQNVTLFYKNQPIQKFAAVDYGFNKDDVHVFQRTLISKLTDDKSFCIKLLSAQSDSKKQNILNKFPELGV